MPHEAGFNTADNPYNNEEFFKICEDYGAPHDPMRYWDEKFYWTYQRGIGWPDDQGFTNVGLLRISESFRALRIFNSKFISLCEVA